MAKIEQDTIEIRGLENLKKALKLDKVPHIKIGVLGKSARTGEISNATIGAVHEFGAPNRGIPQRSFLRMPISENFQKEMENSGAFDSEVLNQVITQKNITPWVQKVAIIAEGIVDDAFETKGFGQWAPWSNPNYKNEGGTLLVDTGQLRQSITSEVVK